MTPRCAASTRSLRTWSVAWPRSSSLPIVCQYASRAASTSDATAKKAKSTRSPACEIVEDEEKPGDDDAAHDEERADLPARAPRDRAAIRGTAVDGLPQGTVLHAPHMRRAHGLRERQGRRSATRRAALRARGLRPTSAEAARSGRRVTTRKPARCPQTQVGRWGGQMQSRDSRAKNCLTIRSSSE